MSQSSFQNSTERNTASMAENPAKGRARCRHRRQDYFQPSTNFTGSSPLCNPNGTVPFCWKIFFSSTAHSCANVCGVVGRISEWQVCVRLQLQLALTSTKHIIPFSLVPDDSGTYPHTTETYESFCVLANSEYRSNCRGSVGSGSSLCIQAQQKGRLSSTRLRLENLRPLSIHCRKLILGKSTTESRSSI